MEQNDSSGGMRKTSDSGAEFFEQLSATGIIPQITSTAQQKPLEIKPETKIIDPAKEFDQYSDNFLSLIKSNKEESKKEPEISQNIPKLIENLPKPVPEIVEPKIALVKPIARKAVPAQKVEEQKILSSPIVAQPIPTQPIVSQPIISKTSASPQAQISDPNVNITVNPTLYKDNLIIPQQKPIIQQISEIKPKIEENKNVILDKIQQKFGLNVCNKGSIIFSLKNTFIGFMKINSFSKNINEICVQIHKVLFTGMQNTSEELVKLIQKLILENAEKTPYYEKLLWELINAVLSNKSLDIFKVSIEQNGLRNQIIKILEEYALIQEKTMPKNDAKKPKNQQISELQIPKEEATEKTLLEMARNGNWMEAILLSQYINPLMCAKLSELYLESNYNGNPIYALLLLNQGAVEKIFTLNPEITIYWASTLAFFLKNLEICNARYLQEFMQILIANVKHRNYAEYLFLHLICGIPILSLEEFYLGLGKSLRHYLMSELICNLWSFYIKPANSDQVKAQLVSIYYGKALNFTELGYTVSALESLKQINALKILGKSWIIYSKLLDLTELLQNKIIKHDLNTRVQNISPTLKKQGGIISTIASGITGLLLGKPQENIVTQEIKKEEKKQEEIVKNERFYYDKDKKKWIIDGKEASAEYDMGQEPLTKSKSADILPPPLPQVISPSSSLPKPIPKPAPLIEESKKIADPFSYKLPQKPEVVKTVIHQPKYINKP